MNSPQSPRDRQITEVRHAKSNFVSIALFQIFLRIGWIFKTETVIMPAVLDLIGGGGWLRGYLPMLNRFGQSIPGVLLSDQIRNLPRKKFALFLTTLAMGVCFLVLAGVWAATDGKFVGMAWVFLIVYAIFFIATGLAQLLSNTLIGKLVVPTIRGKLAATSSIVGGTIAVLSAWFLLQRWLGESSGRFEWIFGFTGLAFCVAAVVSLTLSETVDTNPVEVKSIRSRLRCVLEPVKSDRNVRCLMILAGMFGMGIVLMPHYQNIARERLGLGLRSLIYWVIAQNIGASLLTIPLGWLADRAGNRIVLKLLMFMMCVIPLLALGLSRMGKTGEFLFPVVFFLLGLTPIALRFLTNYTLEMTSRENHPLYLSTLGLFVSVPVMASSVILGALVDIAGFETVFLTIFCFLLCGFGMTFQLIEPRTRLSENEEPELS